MMTTASKIDMRKKTRKNANVPEEEHKWTMTTTTKTEYTICVLNGSDCDSNA